MTSPTQRTLAHLRHLGYTAVVTERWNPFAKVRQDFAGFADVLAFKTGEPGVLAVQCTTTDHQANRLAKVMELPQVKTWLEAGNGLEIWGWSLAGPRGKRKCWTLTRRPVTLADLGSEVVGGGGCAGPSVINEVSAPPKE